MKVSKERLEKEDLQGIEVNLVRKEIKEIKEKGVLWGQKENLV